MSIFGYINGKIQVEPQNLTIPEFKAIFDRDESEDKSQAFAELCFIYHMSDHKSPYNNYDKDQKITKLLDDYFKGTNWVPDRLIELAIQRYLEINETPSMKLLKDAKKAIEKVRKYYQTVNLDDVDAKGQKVHKISELSNSISSIGKMVESLDKLEERIKKEESTNTKIRGDREISEFERV